MKSSIKEKTKLYIQNLKDRNFFFYFCRIFASLFFLILFFTPFGMQALSLENRLSQSKLIFPFLLPIYFTPGRALFFLSFLIYLLPLNSIYLITSIFLKKKDRLILYFINFSLLTLYLLTAFTNMIIFANCPRWFLQLPVFIYCIVAMALISHIIMAFYTIDLVRTSNPEYLSYIESEKNSAKTKQTHIKTKLTLTIMTTLSLILILFMILVLHSYQRMFTIAISDTGYSQAQQTANVYDSADGTYEKIKTFLTSQKEANHYANIPFERIDIIVPQTRILNASNLYIENFAKPNFQSEDKAENKMSPLPAFNTLAYTTSIDKYGKAVNIPADEKIISEAQAQEILKKYVSGAFRNAPVYNKNSHTAKFYYPVTYTRQKGHLLQGFAVVTYQQELLMQSLFRTKVFVITLVLFFIYFSILVSLVIADFITNPLLYLKTNIKNTSDTLYQILHRSSDQSIPQLSFNDSIKTKDEIKNLSLEVKNMVTLIKGVIPFISTSTLKAAENDKSKASSAKDLCFLFTDIRGFTSLCEGHKPKEIVDILNHYLEIETNIILKNGGDVDKFVGDEMMAFFSGAKKEYNACKASMEIRAAMRNEQQKALMNGNEFISIGIGINTGKVVFGSVGSEYRKDFTSIGDVVNTAARLESANKAYGSKSLITQAVYDKIKDKFICREMDYITVKGKKEVCCIYEILQEKESAGEKLYEIKELFEKGLYFYRKQKWDKAEDFFTQCATVYNDMPSVIFLDRIKHFKETPPAKNWNGVFNLRVK